MRFAAMTAFLLLGAAVGSSDLAAQAPPRTGSFRGSVGLGWGSFRVSCPSPCVGERNGGMAGHGTIGVAVGNGLVIGGELSGWTDTYTFGAQDAEFKERVYLLGPFVEWYPAPSRPLHLAIAMGYLSYKLEDRDDPDAPTTGSTFGVHVRGGYDFQLVKGLKLSPYVAFQGGVSSSLNDDDFQAPVPDATFSLFHLGLALTVP